MKKRILKMFMLLFVVIPCAIVFAACGNKDDSTTPEPQTAPVQQQPTLEPVDVVTLSEISASLANDGEGFNYDAETNTFMFEYGTVIEIGKDDFEMTASYSNETTTTIDEYEIDLSEIPEVPDVGNYKIKLTYQEKVIEFGVRVYPKAINKPVFENSYDDCYEKFIYSTNRRGEPIGFSIELEFDENFMEMTSDSIIEATEVGDYQVKIVPKSNYVWATFAGSQKEEVIVNWKITKATLFMASPETLTFDFAQDTTHTIKFVPFIDDIQFDDYFEVVSGTISESEVGEYSFVIRIKADKINNYEVIEVNYFEADDEISYNDDYTEITYYWSIA